MFRTLLKVLLLGAALLSATTAQAVIDENDDTMGLYFDTDGDTDCLDSVALLSQVPCYIVLTHPTFSELHGFEVGFDYGSELALMGTELAHDQALNVGSAGNLIVGFGSPTYTEEATLLATLNLMYMDPAGQPATITLRGTSPSSLDAAYPSVLLAGGELMSTGIHQPTFTSHMNGICTWDDREAGWEQVKVLYR